MGAPIQVTILVPNPNQDVQLDANGRFLINGAIAPSDPAYTVRAFLVRADTSNPADPANRIEGVHNVGSPSPGGTTFDMNFTVPSSLQNVSLLLVVVVQDGNDVGGGGFTIRCIPQPP